MSVLPTGIRYCRDFGLNERFLVAAVGRGIVLFVHAFRVENMSDVVALVTF